jgi:hypothetical protein
MHQQANSVNSLRSRPAPLGLMAAALAMVVAAGGCQTMGEPEPKQPRTVTEFMKQPRPGDGVLGP